MKKSVIFYVSFGPVKRLGNIKKQSFCYKKIVLLSLFIINFSLYSQEMKLKGNNFEAGVICNDQSVPLEKHKKGFLSKLFFCFYQSRVQKNALIELPHSDINEQEGAQDSESLKGLSGSINSELCQEHNGDKSFLKNQFLQDQKMIQPDGYAENLFCRKKIETVV